MTAVSCKRSSSALRKEDPRAVSAGAEPSVEVAGADSVVDDVAAAAGVDSVAGVEAAGAEAAGAGEDEAGAGAAAAGVDDDAAAAAGVALGCESQSRSIIPVHNVAHLGHHHNKEVLLLDLEVADGRIVLQNLSYNVSL